jgi:hypothetical protein
MKTRDEVIDQLRTICRDMGAVLDEVENLLLELEADRAEEINGESETKP